ncbi:MAG TPA: biosynthetic peptidoglycan transglycosylase, partial [Longimicrobium sp.]
ITQQLARNLYLRPERTVRRKLREALIAGSLERHLTKREILELHLNVVEWGDGVWGIGQAAPHYLGRSPTSVGAFEAAFLASLLPAPRRPLAGANLLRARRVQGRVLTQLHLSGMLDVREWRGAMGSRRAFVTAMTRGSRPAWALAMARVAPPADLRDPAPASVVRLPASRALDSACGRAVELRSSGAVGRGAGR